MRETRGFAFTAVILQVQEGKGGSYVEFPFDTKECFGTGSRVKVVCLFDDVSYRGSLVKMGIDSHILGITKDIMEKIGKKPGDTVRVSLRDDTEERVIMVSRWLAEKLAENIELNEAYTSLSYTKKKEMNLALESAKQDATRQKRLKKIIDELETRLDGRRA